jgi:hypothetical protein
MSFSTGLPREFPACRILFGRAAINPARVPSHETAIDSGNQSFFACFRKDKLKG